MSHSDAQICNLYDDNTRMVPRSGWWVAVALQVKWLGWIPPSAGNYSPMDAHRYMRINQPDTTGTHLGHALNGFQFLLNCLLLYSRAWLLLIAAWTCARL